MARTVLPSRGGVKHLPFAYTLRPVRARCAHTMGASVSEAISSSCWMGDRESALEQYDRSARRPSSEWKSGEASAQARALRGNAAGHPDCFKNGLTGLKSRAPGAQARGRRSDNIPSRGYTAKSAMLRAPPEAE